MKFLFTTTVVLLLSQTVTATWNKGCGGGCGNPCSSGYNCGEPATLLETSGCAGGACVTSGGGGGGYHTKKTTTIVKEEKNDEFSLVIGGGSHGQTAHKQYVQPEVQHSDSYVEQPVEIIKKKTIVSQPEPQISTWMEPIGMVIKKKTTYIQPSPVVHQTHHRSHHESYIDEPSVDTIVTKRKTSYVSAPVSEVRGYSKETYVQPIQPVITRKTTFITEPVVHKTTIYKQPIVVHKHRYVSAPAPSIENECSGPCGGSKLVKIIKKTSYSNDGEYCQECDDNSGSSGYNSRYETQSEPETIVQKKFTKVISSGPSYTSSNNCYGGNCGGSSRYFSECSGGECGGYEGYNKGGGYRNYNKAGGYAFASASASAGSYNGDRGGGEGCKSGCDQWK